MNYTRRNFMFLLSAAALIPLAGCSSNSTSSTTSSSSSSSSTTLKPSGDIAIDNAKWNYDSDNDVYWQIGLSYCTSPVADDYESYGIYVPGAYFSGKKNSDGSTYTCAVNASGAKGNFTAKSAPYVFPINGAGYAAQAAPTQYSYNGLSNYLEAGFIYVYAGMRGRNNGYDDSGNLTYSGGAPWGITDAKAAIRTVRYNAANLPGNSERIFTFGMSGGGALSSLVGATGDSALYTPYLESIGAPTKDATGTALSDAVFGSMCWCPITSLDVANEAYEWMMGQYVTSGTRADGTFTAALSKDLAKSFAASVNRMGLVDATGTALTLEETSSGVYAGGTYYDCILSTIEESLNNFLSDTTFPYTPGSSQTNADGNFGGGAGDSASASGGRGASGGQGPSGSQDSSGGQPPSGSQDSSGGKPSGDMPSGQGQGAPSGVSSGSSGSSSSSSAQGSASSNAAGGPQGMTGTSTSTNNTTYDTAQSYIDSLNGSSAWITYDAATNTAKVSSISAFVNACKQPSKDVCAFDSLSRSQAENMVFGNDESDALHFDPIIASLLSDKKADYAALSNWDASYVDAYAGDLKKVDHLDNSIEYRMNAYNPMYYACKGYTGYGTSSVAKHWRIHTGINQSDTSLTTEKNLALALQANPNVNDVEFTTVWGMGHTMAERTGNSTSNFVSWVQTCCK